MEIVKWSGSIKFIGKEKTDPATQTIELTGTSCKREAFPQKVAEKLASAMQILGNTADLKKQLDKQATTIESQKQRIDLLEEANKAAADKAAHVAVTGDVEEPEPAEHPVTPRPTSTRSRSSGR